jgi:putative aldouronate transport system permease protein
MWEEQLTRIGQFLKAVVLILVVLGVLFPLWVILATSLASRATIAAAGGFVIVPRGIDISAYQTSTVSPGRARSVTAGCSPTSCCRSCSTRRWSRSIWW